MKNAFLILAHSDPLHLERLADALWSQSDVYVHLDKKSNIAEFAQVAQRKHVTFIARRHAVSWAGISMVSAMLELIAAALESGQEYGHLVFLTGSDYPLKDQQSILRVLDENPTKEFVKLSDVRESPNRYLKLITQRHFREPFFDFRNKSFVFADKAVRKLLSLLRLKNEWRADIVPYRGHTWCALTSACCRHILEYHRDNPWYFKMNVHTLAPDEHYFHTIIGNSPFANSAVRQKCQGGLWPMAMTHLIDPSLTKWFTVADWDTVSASDRLFIRKIRSIDGSLLVQRIDEKLRGLSKSI